jgi:hypothetical protein
VRCRVSRLATCFEFEGDRGRCETVWRILDVIGSGPDTIWPVKLVHLPLGRKLGSTDVLQSRVTSAVRNGRLELDGEPISLTALAEVLDDAS